MNFLIQYKVKPELVAEQEAAIAEFLDAINEVGDSEVSYISFKAEDGVSFSHLARMGSEDALKRFQSQPHFKKFSGEIKARCEDGPHATKMSVVASTDG